MWLVKKNINVSLNILLGGGVKGLNNVSWQNIYYIPIIFFFIRQLQCKNINWCSSLLSPSDVINITIWLTQCGKKLQEIIKMIRNPLNNYTIWRKSGPKNDNGSLTTKEKRYWTHWCVTARLNVELAKM